MKDRVKNIIYNAVYQVFIIVIPILTMPYVSRKLGAENLGINTYTQSLVLLLGLFINSSILQIGAREIARQDRISRTKTFVTLWLLQVLCGLFIIIVYLSIVMGSRYYYYYLLQLPFLISYIFDISWFFIGLEKIKNVVFRNIFVKICTIFLIFLLIKNKSDLSIYIIIISLGSLIGNFIFFFSLKKHLDFGKNVGLDLSNIRPFIHSIIILLVPQLAVQLYQYIVKFSIENSTTATELSYFDQSQKIARIIIQLVSSISIVLMPVIANLDKNKSKNALNKIIKLSVHYSLSIAVLFTIILVLISPTFVPLFFGSEFKEMIPHMMISSFIIIPICVGGVFSNQLVLGMGLYKYYAAPYLIGGSIGILICLIYKDKMNGLIGCIVLVTVESLICFFRIILANKIIDIKESLQGTKKEFFLLLLLLTEVYIVNTILAPHSSLLLNLSYMIIVIIQYFIFSIIIKTETAKDFFKRLKLSLLK